MAPGGSAAAAACPPARGAGLKVNTSLAGAPAAGATAAAAAAAACCAGGGAWLGGTYEARNCCSWRTRHTQGLGRAWPRVTMVEGLQRKGWGRGIEVGTGAGQARALHARAGPPCLPKQNRITLPPGAHPPNEMTSFSCSTLRKDKAAQPPL